MVLQKNQNNNNRLANIIVILAIIACLAWIVSGIFSLFSDNGQNLDGNVAIIPIKGVIMGDSSSGLFDEDIVDSTTIIGLIDEAENNPSVDAIVLEINSPGGSAVASDEIGSRIKKVKKPTVAWIREVGASGGYWIASSTDHIVANRMSITGSIGVISSYLDFSGLMARYNVSYERLVAGEYKDAGIPFRQLRDEERELFQKKLDLIYIEFVKEVAANRNITYDKVEEMANGFFYLGSEAKDLGLVDELGGKEEVSNYLHKKIGKEIKFVEYSAKKTFFEKLAGVISNGSYRIGEGIGSAFVKSQEKKTLLLS